MLNLIGKLLLLIGQTLLKIFQNNRSKPRLIDTSWDQEYYSEFERLEKEKQRMLDEIAWHKAYEYDPHDKSDVRNSFFYSQDPYDPHSHF